MAASLKNAKSMRQEPTPAERALWQALRSKQVSGLKWRRQAPIGPYIVDFFCPYLRLIVEVDGATHAEPNADAARDAWLRVNGYSVLRFWNNEVLGNLPGVLERIAAYPSPNLRTIEESSPLPLREGLGGGVATPPKSPLSESHAVKLGACGTPPPNPFPQGEGALDVDAFPTA